MAPSIFAGVFYYTSISIPSCLRDQLKQILDDEGASDVPLDDPLLTHFITLTPPSDDVLERIPNKDKVQQVIPTWAERSFVLGKQQAAEHYSPNPANLFSGITATATDLSPADLELLSAGITSLGGQWRTALTRDVTHLFALSPGSAKYETAMHYREQTAMCVLVPHWFDDTVRLGIRGLPTDEYEWPHPRVFKPETSTDGAAPDVPYRLSSEKKRFYETALASSFDRRLSRAPPRNIWNGLRILLSDSLELSASQRDAHEEDIRREGGIIIPLSLIGSGTLLEVAQEEARQVQQADVLITRYRVGVAYVKAFKAKKTIGSMTWLWHVRSTGALSRPTDKLLHYPIPKGAPEGFAEHSITITNYTGKDREYLKKLVSTMGGKFTASMSNTNTIVIAAYVGGTKTAKAVSWSIPLVNHTWLEDAFVHWRAPTPALEKYLCFPPGVDFGGLLSERGVGPLEYTQQELAAMARAGIPGTEAEKAAAKEKALALTEGKSFGKNGTEDGVEGSRDRHIRATPSPARTGNSAREVEDVVMGEVVDASIMDVDADILPPRDKDAGAMDVDEGHGAKPSTKKGDGKKKVVTVDEDEAEDENVPVPSVPLPRPPKKKLVRRYSRQSSSDVAPSVPEPEELEKQQLQPITSPSRSVLRQYKSKSRLEAEEAQDKMKIGPPKRKPRQDKQKANRADKEREDDRPAPKVRPSKRKTIIPMDSSEDEDMEPPKAESSARRKPTQKADAPPKPIKGFKLPIQGDLDSSDSSSSAAPAHPKRTGPASRSATVPESVAPSRSSTSPTKLRQQVSVLVPTAASVYSSPKSKKSVQGTPAKSALRRTDSVRAAAPEASVQSPTKRGRPSGSAKRAASSVSFQPPTEDSTTITTAPMPAALTRTPSRRSAATRATRKLHEEIMPDVMNFQKEMKNGTVRSVWEAEERDKSKSASVGALDEDARKGRGKKRVSGAAEEHGAEEQEEQPMKKRLRTSVGTASAKKGKAGVAGGARQSSGKRKRDSSSSSEEDSSEAGIGKPRRKPESGAKRVSLGAANTSRTNPKNARIMTTQLSVSDDVKQVLTRMGVKMTTKPTECTHLVTNNVVRTEKFLCALPVVQHILSEKWLLASAATKQLLPESDYALVDPEAEKKFGFKLAEALRRAHAGKLFAGMTFYATPRIGVDHKLLKNVVTANGGQLSTQTPTARILSGQAHRYVISSPTDVSIWRPLAEQGHAVYTQELILTGALRQEIDWDSPTNRVAGSVEA
ncbi:hypothetical protein SCP_0116860 [Sparassis crispa]|uniref:BRCT domain-containing protein n=1 Tax=Sparassis crispa TaxID=139825 RepID=A0A401G9H9_9APHY|nr:hypothetical protein SCP_0116860 [Sparassis crispa]GBE78793.1 hypothetical protein SCP_0116860 [Sparassis crispa]